MAWLLFTYIVAVLIIPFSGTPCSILFICLFLHIPVSHMSVNIPTLFIIVLSSLVLILGTRLVIVIVRAGQLSGY